MVTAQRLSGGFPNSIRRDFFIHDKALALSKNHTGNDAQIFHKLGDIIPNLWQEYSVLVFVMATGIVVRQIASLIEGKDRDPAVLVLDEAGKFIIPLLSGHLGGANAWANQLARQSGALAVITTATDGRGLVAPDEYARRYHWQVEPIDHLPTVNRLLLEQGSLKVWTSYTLPPEYAWLNDEHYQFLSENEKVKANVIVSAFPDLNLQDDCVYLIPPVLRIGVGCRRGVSPKVVLEAVTAAVKQIGASLKAVAGIYSIDLKSDEEGLIETARFLRVPFQTFSTEELQSVIEREQLSRSKFVSEKIGVDGVCEAASLLGTQMGQLVLPKIKGQGVTVAISLENSLSWASDPEILTI
ncbi:cbiG family protein [Desulfosporosinus sp. OT]|nr:cbiG family protein [Desulfosporosinus sp. OT]